MADPQAALRERLAELGPEPKSSELFDAVDTDRSGQISREEFVPVWCHNRQLVRETEAAKAGEDKHRGVARAYMWSALGGFILVLVIVGLMAGARASPSIPICQLLPPTLRSLPRRSLPAQPSPSARSPPTRTPTHRRRRPTPYR